MELSLEEQCEVLQNIIASFSPSAQNIDLSLIGESAHTGTVRLSKKLNKIEECVLVNQSVTGLFEKEVDLLQL